MADSIDELYSRGREAFAKGDYAAALECLEAVVKERRYPDAYNKLGQIYHGRGELSKAAQAFRKALKINPGYTEVSLNLSVTLNDMGRYAEANDVFIKAANIAHSAPYTLDPFIKGKLANEHAKLAHIYYDMGLYGEAVDEYKKALNLRPDCPDITTKIGMAYREKGLYNEAIHEFMKAKEINPRYMPARTNLGITYYMKGFVDMAVDEWKEALTINPNSEDARMYLNFVQAEREVEENPESLDDLE